MRIEYFLDEFIDILKKRDYSRLGFHKLDNGYPYAYCFLYTTGTSADEDEAFANGTPDSFEVHVYAPDNTISDETADRMIHVLEHLDECIQKAYVWLSKQDLHDDWLTQPEYSPQDLAQLFIMWELHFGVSDSKKPLGGSFSLSFDLPDSWYYPWHYDVWFHYDDLQPYKSEKDLW